MPNVESAAFIVAMAAENNRPMAAGYGFAFRVRPKSLRISCALAQSAMEDGNKNRH